MATSADATTTRTTTVDSSDGPSPSPETPQRYDLVGKRRLSPDTCLLRFALPPGRDFLGADPTLPTCLKVTMPMGAYPDQKKEKAKSYSPVSHPATRGTFDLLVKAYPYRVGGGVGAWLCGLEPDDDENNNNSSIVAALKSPRSMHGSPVLRARWRRVGLVAGGTGIAPLFQLALALLDNNDDETSTCATTEVSLLNINREDALLREEADALAESSGGRFRVVHWMTGGETTTTDDDATRRGDADLARRTLPPPSETDGDTMIFVCGTDDFVAHWGGPVLRSPPKPNGKKGSKIQGPLLGVLKKAGYRETEVFKY